MKQFNLAIAIALLLLAASAGAVRNQRSAMPSATVIRAGLLIDVEAGTAAAKPQAG